MSHKTPAPRPRRLLRLAICGLVGALPGGALASGAEFITPAFDSPATLAVQRAEPAASLAVATGPWKAGAIPAITAEGALRQTAWHLDAPGRSTLDLLRPLRDQLRAAGYVPVFECEAQTCGGFDFRYGTDILPEPEMHVDLGDYRFLAARRDGAGGTDWLTLIVSRSADTGFVQVTTIGTGGAGGTGADLSLSTKSAGGDGDTSGTTDPAMTAAAAPASGLRLQPGIAVVLDGLVFASGRGALTPGDYPALRDLATWLIENPQARVDLVGHTDASGKAADNTALSLARAQSARDALVSLGIDAARITARGAGPSEPRASNDTPEGRAQNRRVEVILTPTP